MKKRTFSVLCVDRDGFGLQVRRMVLESFGCKVLACTSGSDALASLASRSFDIVVMDSAVEGMQGEDLAREIKRTQPRMPVLMLSSTVYPPDTMRPYIDGFATKGEAPKTLMNTIEKSIRASRAAETRHIEQGWLGGIAAGGARLLARAFDRNKRRREPSERPPEADTWRAPQSRNNSAHA